MSGSDAPLRGTWLCGTFRKDWPLAVYSADGGLRNLTLDPLRRHPGAADRIIPRQGWLAVQIGERAWCLPDRQWSSLRLLADAPIVIVARSADPDCALLSTSAGGEWTHVIVDQFGTVRRRARSSGSGPFEELQDHRLVTGEGTLVKGRLVPYTSGWTFGGMLSDWLALMWTTDAATRVVDLRDQRTLMELPGIYGDTNRSADGDSAVSWRSDGAGLVSTAEGNLFEVHVGSFPKHAFWLDRWLLSVRPRRSILLIDLRTRELWPWQGLPGWCFPDVDVTDRVDASELGADPSQV